jgi:hypothetical protein
VGEGSVSELIEGKSKFFTPAKGEPGVSNLLFEGLSELSTPAKVAASSVHPWYHSDLLCFRIPAAQALAGLPNV